jgi:hypothetical protein
LLQSTKYDIQYFLKNITGTSKLFFPQFRILSQNFIPSCSQLAKNYMCTKNASQDATKGQKKQGTLQTIKVDVDLPPHFSH